MRLTKKQMILISFMLFSLFFGAGNLIFPPFLGQNAGTNMPVAILFFLITAVALPVLGVVVVAKFDGLQQLAAKVNPQFALIFTLLIYLSIGPGLGIPRAASVPFEMAVAPYLPAGSPLTLYMLIYSGIFFAIAIWLALTPNKLVERIGKVLTPSLLILIIFLFVSFLFKGHSAIALPQASYADAPAVVGFLEGYNTMDTIAALNFGFVIATTISSFHVSSKKDIMHYTLVCGIFAGIILALIYLMLAYMGMEVSGLYALRENGAWTLRCIVEDVFGSFGAIVLAMIFSLACLTTCVGLITSISQYFAGLFKRFSYRQFVVMITLFAFVICNQGLNTILSISVPVLNAIYPIAIVLIILGLCDEHLKDIPYIYPLTILGVGIVSVIYALDGLKISLPLISDICAKLPFYQLGIGWSIVGLVIAAACYLYAKIKDMMIVD